MCEWQLSLLSYIGFNCITLVYTVLWWNRYCGLSSTLYEHYLCSVQSPIVVYLWVCELGNSDTYSTLLNWWPQYHTVVWNIVDFETRSFRNLFTTLSWQTQQGQTKQVLTPHTRMLARSSGNVSQLINLQTQTSTQKYTQNINPAGAKRVRHTHMTYKQKN